MIASNRSHTPAAAKSPAASPLLLPAEKHPGYAPSSEVVNESIEPLLPLLLPVE